MLVETLVSRVIPDLNEDPRGVKFDVDKVPEVQHNNNAMGVGLGKYFAVVILSRYVLQSPRIRLFVPPRPTEVVVFLLQVKDMVCRQCQVLCKNNGEILWSIVLLVEREGSGRSYGNILR